MLPELYIEALLVDKDLADQVESLLSANMISLGDAAVAWWLIAFGQQLGPR